MFQFSLLEEELLPLPELGRGNEQERRLAMEEFKAVAEINFEILDRQNKYSQLYWQKVISVATLIMWLAFVFWLKHVS